MKYLIIVLLAILGIGLGVFIGLGGLEGMEIVIFIAIFPVAFIFGTILLGKNTKDEKVKPVKTNSKWDKIDKYE